MDATRRRRVRSLGAAALIVATALIGGAWTWPTWPPPRPYPVPTVTSSTPAPSGRPQLVIVSPDPLVLNSGPTVVTHPLLVRNIGPVDDTGGFSVSISGSANVALSTGTCSRPLKKAGTAGDSCTMSLRVRANAAAGTSTITVKGGPRSTGDSLVVRIVPPPQP